jgi:hypothetical protein
VISKSLIFINMRWSGKTLIFINMRWSGKINDRHQHVPKNWCKQHMCANCIPHTPETWGDQQITGLHQHEVIRKNTDLHQHEVIRKNQWSSSNVSKNGSKQHMYANCTPHTPETWGDQQITDLHQHEVIRKNTDLHQHEVIRKNQWSFINMFPGTSANNTCMPSLIYEMALKI